MNRPIARGLRGLLYVLWDLSQVDPSDLSALFGGYGRLRIGFSEIEPPARVDPTDEQIEEAVRGCWENSYYALAKPVGTSLICIQGDWSNVVDGKIKGGLASLARGGIAEPTYNPLYARAHHAPKPWGITALFAEYTGIHPPLDIEWPVEKERGWVASPPSNTSERKAGIVKIPVAVALPVSKPPEPGIVEPGRVAQQHPSHHRGFSSFREFAVALNRLDGEALALAKNGALDEFPIDPSELRKLLGTVWFRSVFARLSKDWQDRLLEALVASGPIHNHLLRNGRRTVYLSDLTLDQLEQVMAETIFPDAVRNDLQWLVSIGRFWGNDALKRFEFTPVPTASENSRFAQLVQPFRRM
jgi:hypothetical protein